MVGRFTGLALAATFLTPLLVSGAEQISDPGFPRAGPHEVEDYCYARAIMGDARCTLTWCGATLEKSMTAECRSYCFELVSDEAVRCIPDAARSLRAEYLEGAKPDVAGYCRKIYAQVRDAWVAKGLPASEAKIRTEKSVASCEARVGIRLASRVSSSAGK